MRKQFLLFIAMLFLILPSLLAQSENEVRIFKKFKVDVSLGYAMPQESGGSGTKAGILFVVEPKYALMDQLAVGLRLEAAVMANVDLDGESGNAKANASYLATGDYYLSNNKFRPFVGGGMGIFTFASLNVDDFEEFDKSIPIGSKFGFMGRAGFEAGHFRLGAEYNFVGNKMGYLGLKIGAVIGGGRL